MSAGHRNLAAGRAIRLGTASLKGSPGATTLVTLLAALWGTQRRVIVDADIDGSTLLPRYAHRLRPEPNVATLATACRHGFDEEALWRNTQRLFDTVDVVIGADSPTVTERGLTDLRPHLRLAWSSMPSVAWFWDLGRLRDGTVTAEIAASLEVVVICAAPVFEGVEPLLKRAPAIDALGCPVAVVLIGDGPIRPGEVDEAMRERTSGRVGVAGAIPACRRDVDVWNATPTVIPAGRARRRFGASRLVASAASVRDRLLEATVKADRGTTR